MIDASKIRIVHEAKKNRVVIWCEDRWVAQFLAEDNRLIISEGYGSNPYGFREVDESKDVGNNRHFQLMKRDAKDIVDQ